MQACVSGIADADKPDCLALIQESMLTTPTDANCVAAQNGDLAFDVQVVWAGLQDDAVQFQPIVEEDSDSFAEIRTLLEEQTHGAK